MSEIDAENDVMLPKPYKMKEDSRAKVLIGCLIFVIVLLAAMTVLSVILIVDKSETTRAPRNVILMISDGFGPASETFARNYAQYKGNHPYSFMLPLDTIQVGASRTRSSDSLVTDSAAGATAFSCALKSYNGAIAVDDNQKPCATVLEAAQKKGMKTGLIATSRITHATPASFAAHVIDRDMEDEIAEQEIEHVVDIMLGGGRKHFLPDSRQDKKDLIQTAKNKGYHYIQTKGELDSLSGQAKDLPLLGLFAMSHMDYLIDRNSEEQPSLPQMVSKTLSILTDATKGNSQGFFLMIEGSRIDHAAHENDAASHFYEIWEYNEAVEMVKKYVDDNGDTVMISVSDHECGGLTVARQVSPEYPEYRWNPEALDGVKNSAYKLASLLLTFQGTDEEIVTYIDKLVRENLGITDATQEEKDNLFRYAKDKNGEGALYAFAEMVNVRAELGWTTHGHSGVDVNLYAYGPMSEDLNGNRENTEIGDFIINVLGLDLSSVTLPTNLIPRKIKEPKKLPEDFEERERRYHHKAIHRDL